MGGDQALGVRSDPLALSGHPCACPVAHSLLVSDLLDFTTYLGGERLASYGQKWFLTRTRVARFPSAR